MGMYTELIFGATLKENTPDDIIHLLKWMVEHKQNEDYIIPYIPDHPFFKCDKWWNLFHCGSYYFAVHHSTPVFRFDTIGNNWILNTRSNLKNYDDNIDKFLDWILPYIDAGSGIRDFYAIVCYEEQAEPTIYYLRDKD